jgi:hypothetical protein
MAAVPKLPFVDEHEVLVRAPAADVWRELGASLPRRIGGSVAAVVLGIVPARAHGDPLTTGAAIQGFRVVEAVPTRRLALAGRHRFSDYALTFDLEERDAATRLTARTNARFPGLRGRAYRALVIGSGGHRLAMRWWLERIRRAAEKRAV